MWDDFIDVSGILGNASAAEENSKKLAASTKVYHHLEMHCFVISSNAITMNLFSIGDAGL